MVYKWKDEFVSNASNVFENTAEAKADQRQIDNLHRKIGELKMELDFAKRASVALGIEMPAKKKISPKSGFSLNRQMNILGISKGNYYYKAVPDIVEDLKICGLIDKEHLEHPTKGVMQMREYLLTLNIISCPKRVRRLMRKMVIKAFYPKPNRYGLRI